MLFKAVADPVRLRLLSLIACHEGGESCVCDLTAAFDMTAPSVSYHLRILREAGLISAERRGTWVYYRVNPDVLTRMSAVLVPQPAVLAAGERARRSRPARAGRVHSAPGCWSRSWSARGSWRCACRPAGRRARAAGELRWRRRPAWR